MIYYYIRFVRHSRNISINRTPYYTIMPALELISYFRTEYVHMKGIIYILSFCRKTVFIMQSMQPGGLGTIVAPCVAVT